jgi:hypothetical protein
MRVALLVALYVGVVLPSTAEARDLTDAEKVLIADAVREGKQAPVSARYEWPPLVQEYQKEYCAWVDPGTGRVPFQALLIWHNGQLAFPIIVVVGDRGVPAETVAGLCKQMGAPL